MYQLRLLQNDCLSRGKNVETFGNKLTTSRLLRLVTTYRPAQRDNLPTDRPSCITRHSQELVPACLGTRKPH